MHGLASRVVSLLAITGLAHALVACDNPPPATARGDFASEAFWDTPMPGEHRRTADGHIDMAGLPVSTRAAITVVLRDAVAEQTGFGTTTPVFFPLTVPIDPENLPGPTDPGSFDAPVALVDVDPDSPERGLFAPVVGHFLEVSGPYGPPNLLTFMPVQGRPLRPDTLYAAVLTDALRRADGQALTTAPFVAAIEDGVRPAGMSEEVFAIFSDAHATLLELGLPASRLIAMTAFRTGTPTRIFDRALTGARANGEAITLDGPFDAPVIYDTYCAYHAVARVPVFQAGVPPYASEGGRWVLDGSGAPVRQREETANLWVTVPRAAMPTDGFPAAVLSRTGSGADRPLMDRGHRSSPGGPVDAPGAGLGLDFARAGYIGVSIEGPLGGSRNPTVTGDEQLLVFNILNAPALRDNLRQSALELALLVDTIETFSIDVSSCPGVTTPRGDGLANVDMRTLALVGHSMGASIAPLTAAFEPRYRALILSGAGGSWMENILHKLSPLPTRGIAESLLAYPARGITLTEADPMLGFLQWAGEEADAQVYAPLLVGEPAIGGARHILMFQGIVDTYIPPPVANTLTLGLSIDVAGTFRDSDISAIEGYRSIETLLPLTGGVLAPLPLTGNMDGTTAAVVQLDEDGIEDGHEVMWQRTDARLLVSCFLSTMAETGTPTIVDPASPICD